MPKKRPFCLSIAGFDPSGGAGILADTKTFEQFGVLGLSVISANTIQTENHYQKTHWLKTEVIIEQLTLLLERYPVKHIKIGLIKNAAVLEAVLKTIHEHVADPFILWDPILVPSAGGDLDDNRFTVRLSSILPHVNWITPNLPEYEHLFGTIEPSIVSQSENTAIYLKGGHSKNKGRDILFSGETCYPFNSKINTTLSKHGTGCILSAAMTACRALDYPVIKSVLKSKRYLERALLSNPSLLAYHRF